MSNNASRCKASRMNETFYTGLSTRVIIRVAIYHSKYENLTMTVQSVVFLSLLCCSICVSHQWSDTLPKTQGMIAQGCEIALSPLQSDSGARLFGVLPVLDGIELLKGCTVVKSAVSRSVSETGIEVRAIFVHPASKQRQRWNVTQVADE